MNEESQQIPKGQPAEELQPSENFLAKHWQRGVITIIAFALIYQAFFSPVLSKFEKVEVCSGYNASTECVKYSMLTVDGVKQCEEEKVTIRCFATQTVKLNKKYNIDGTLKEGQTLDSNQN